MTVQELPPPELQSMTKTRSSESQASDRGERLYPPRSSRVHWVLTRLREELERVAAECLKDMTGRESRLIDFGCGNAPIPTNL